jgi:capsular polysaccharide biosynthesis protein
VKTEISLFQALRRNWLAALIVFAVTVGLSWFFNAAQKPVYEATAHLVVAPASLTSEDNVIRAVESLDRRTVLATFARIASAETMPDAAAKRLGLDASRLRGYVTRGSVISNTNVIRVTTSGPEARTAAAVANAVAAATAEQAKALYQVYTLQFLSSARTPRRPVYPDPMRNFLVGVTLAILFAAAAALAADRFRQNPSP